MKLDDLLEGITPENLHSSAWTDWETPSEQVRCAMAIIALDGHKPSEEAIALAHAVAAKKISADEAIAKLLEKYRVD